MMTIFKVDRCSLLYQTLSCGKFFYLVTYFWFSSLKSFFLFCIRETLNRSMCADSSNNTTQKIKKKKIYEKIIIYIYFYRCQVARVECNQSHVTNANSQSQGPSPCYLPRYAQQDAAAGINLDPSTISHKDFSIRHI